MALFNRKPSIAVDDLNQLLKLAGSSDLNGLIRKAADGTAKIESDATAKQANGVGTINAANEEFDKKTAQLRAERDTQVANGQADLNAANALRQQAKANKLILSKFAKIGTIGKK